MYELNDYQRDLLSQLDLDASLGGPAADWTENNQVVSLYPVGFPTLSDLSGCDLFNEQDEAFLRDLADAAYDPELLGTEVWFELLVVTNGGNPDRPFIHAVHPLFDSSDDVEAAFDRITVLISGHPVRVDAPVGWMLDY